MKSGFDILTRRYVNKWNLTHSNSCPSSRVAACLYIDIQSVSRTVWSEYDIFYEPVGALAWKHNNRQSSIRWRCWNHILPIKYSSIVISHQTSNKPKGCLRRGTMISCDHQNSMNWNPGFMYLLYLNMADRLTNKKKFQFYFEVDSVTQDWFRYKGLSTSSHISTLSVI